MQKKNRKIASILSQFPETHETFFIQQVADNNTRLNLFFVKIIVRLILDMLNYFLTIKHNLYFNQADNLI